MTKHFFVAGVTMLGFAMLAGAHASATVRVDGPQTVTSIMPGVFVPGKGFTVARRGADDNPATHDANDDNHRQRRGGRTTAADAAPVLPFSVARRGADDPAGHDANEAAGGDNHRQRRRGRTAEVIDLAPPAPFEIARRGADDTTTGAGTETEQHGNHRQRRRGRDHTDTATPPA